MTNAEYYRDIVAVLTAYRAVCQTGSEPWIWIGKLLDETQRRQEAGEPAATNETIHAAANAIESEVERQYHAGFNWDEAKDVLENLDYCEVARAALRVKP